MVEISKQTSRAFNTKITMSEGNSASDLSPILPSGEGQPSSSSDSSPILPSGEEQPLSSSDVSGGPLAGAGEEVSINNASAARPDEGEAQTADPETKLDFDPDSAFDEPGRIGSALLPPPNKLWTLVDSLGIPTIDLGTNPSPLVILQFVYDMERYKVEDETVRKLILTKALRGHREKEWCRKLNYHFDKIMNKILYRMMQTKEWIDLKGRLEMGEKFGEDVESHIHYFRLIAKYMGLKAESDRTKSLFVKSLGPEIMHPLLARKKDGRSYKNFADIVRAAQSCNAIYVKTVGRNKENGTAELAAAASAYKADRVSLKRMRDESDEEDSDDEEAAAVNYEDGVYFPSKRAKGKIHIDRKQVTCFVCGRKGHLARECRQRKTQGRHNKGNLKKKGGGFNNHKIEQACAFGETQE